MKKLIEIFKFLLLVVVLWALGLSCSAQKKLDRLVTKHPYLLQSRKIEWKDTLNLAPRTILNTDFILPVHGDTLVLESGSALAKIYKTPKGTYHIIVDTKTSVLYYSKSISIPIYTPKPKPIFNIWSSLPLCLFLLLSIIIFIKFFNPQNK